MQPTVWFATSLAWLCATWTPVHAPRLLCLVQGRRARRDAAAAALELCIRKGSRLSHVDKNFRVVAHVCEKPRGVLRTPQVCLVGHQGFQCTSHTLHCHLNFLANE